MKVRINLDNIQPTLSDLTSKGLEDKNLPSCFGVQTPPILDTIIEFEDTEILAVTDGVPNESLLDIDLEEIVEDDKVVVEGKSLTKQGFLKIGEYKEMMASRHVQKLAKCATCEHFEKCNKLTANYIRVVELLSKEKK